MKYFYLIINLFILSCGVSTDKNNENCPDLSDKEMLGFNLEMAELFSVTVYEDHKRISVGDFSEKKEEYILSSSNCNQKHIKFPLEKVVVLSSPHLGMIEALGKSKSVIAIGNSYLTINSKLNNIELVGEGENLNVEKVILLEPNAVFTNKTETTPSTYTKLRKAGIPIIECSEYLEKTPLAQAEWIKFFGVLYNEEAKADSIYNYISRDYNRLKILAQKEVKPSVFFNKKYSDIWYMPAGHHLTSELIRDANAYYNWMYENKTGSLQLSFETVIEHCLNDSIWLNPGCKSKQDLLNEDNRYAEFKALKTNMVYDINKQLKSNGGNGYFESGALYCNLVLQDLIKICHPNLFKNKSFTYYEKLK